MAEHVNIIIDWFTRQSTHQKTSLLKAITDSMARCTNLSTEQMTSELAAGLMAACAHDLGLTTLELAGLLQEPRNDAMVSLVTLLCVEQ